MSIKLLYHEEHIDRTVQALRSGAGRPVHQWTDGTVYPRAHSDWYHNAALILYA
jgi:hypothetical protein